ncbi:MAG TPA: ATP-binding protein [Actinomycetota bacterium]|nr:ATP-binding protein [Actinomycetota bacterium]
MRSVRVYAWTVTASAVSVLLLLLALKPDRLSQLPTLIFWIALLAIAEILPVALGFEARFTMGFPVLLAAAIVLDPAAAMLVGGIGFIDRRELNRTISVHRALFNRSQVMLAVGAMATVFAFFNPFNPISILLAASLDAGINFGLVAGAIHFDRRISFVEAFKGLPPRPILGFSASYALLALLGAATARAYIEIGSGREWVVIAILIPLLFARMTIQGAKAQQELSDRIRRQQAALLAATEQVFQEREQERSRIAETIHDTSLQMLAAAAYGCANTTQLLRSGDLPRAETTISSTQNAVNNAISALRESLVDLRRSAIEEGGLMETIRRFVEQLETIWDARIELEGNVEREPPIPVALAAFQILQEALVNALKHANSETVTIRVGEDEGMLRIAVVDRGTGFDTSHDAGEDHLGMTLMHERAVGVGGSIELDSRPGEGTRVEAVLPAGIGAV